MKTNEFEMKDTARIISMMRKANGYSAKLEQLARNMATAITKADKALRRCRAAEDQNLHNVAAIFYARYQELSGSGLGLAPSDSAEPKTNQELAFESKQPSSPAMTISVKYVSFRAKENPSAKPRIYFWDETENSTIASMFMQRFTPKQVFTPHLDTVLRPLGMAVAKKGTAGDRHGRLLNVKVGWSRFAGCSCPCSPGFVVDNPDYEYDVHVHYEIVTDNAAKRRA